MITTQIKIFSGNAGLETIARIPGAVNIRFGTDENGFLHVYTGNNLADHEADTIISNEVLFEPNTGYLCIQVVRTGFVVDYTQPYSENVSIDGYLIRNNIQKDKKKIYYNDHIHKFGLKVPYADNQLEFCIEQSPV